MNNTQNSKRKPDRQLKDAVESQQRILSPGFDLSTKRIGFGNGPKRVTTIRYESKCHSAQSIMLKSLLIKSSILEPIQLSDSNIHFIPHGLIQSTNSTTIKHQITPQNFFLTPTGIVSIFNIPETTMNFNIKTRLLAIPSVIGLKSICLTKSSEM